MSNASNKTITKNTILLYIRMLFVMVVTLFTSRIVLKALGVDDYGLYNVVGSVVLMFNFLNTSLSISVQRYLSFEIGKRNDDQFTKMFVMSVLINALLSIFIIILCLTLGSWLIEKFVNVPDHQLTIAIDLFYISIVGCIANIIRIPFIACIMAYEHFKVYAYLGVLEAILNLVIAYLLIISTSDRLILYGVLVSTMSVIITIIFIVYCFLRFKTVKIGWYWDKTIFRELSGFAGWSACGEIAWIGSGSCVNFVLNMFYGVVANAARGLAQQVTTAITKFVINFQTAVNPRLIILYAEDNKIDFFNLLFRSTRFSVYLLLFFIIPFFFETPIILRLWLGDVPEYTSVFCRWAIIGALFDTYSNLLATAAKATGRIRRYQLVVSCILFMNLPLSWGALKLGFKVESIYWVYVLISIILLLVRLSMLKKMIGLDVESFFKSMMPTIKVMLLSIISPLFVCYFMPDDILRLIIVGFVSLMSTILAVYYVGLSNNERLFVLNKLKGVI